MDYLNELEQLNLPAGKFAIFGSGPMAVRGIRESSDIDIIVKQDLWDDLVEKYPEALKGDPVHLEIGNIEVYNHWQNLADRTDEMIDGAEIIANFPYVQLKYVVEWKKYANRDKDIRDLELIEKYNSSQK